MAHAGQHFARADVATCGGTLVLGCAARACAIAGTCAARACAVARAGAARACAIARAGAAARERGMRVERPCVLHGGLRCVSGRL